MMTIIRNAMADVFAGNQTFVELVNMAGQGLHIHNLQEMLLSMNARVHEELEFSKNKVVIYYFIEKKNHSYCIRVAVATDTCYVNEFTMLDGEI